MKFRARMVEMIAMKKFYNVLQSITKLTKLCVMRLTEDKVYFIATEPTGSGHLPIGGPSIWCEMEQANFFNEYKLEGVSAEQPEIYLELEPDKLQKAMSLFKSIRALKIKLTKKHDQPCLSFDIDLMPSALKGKDADVTSVKNTLLGRQCVHDVPVTVLPRKLWTDFGEPTMKKSDISIYLPEMKKLKHLTERYKNLGNYVRLEAHHTGKLVLKLESELVTVSTHFDHLEVERQISDNDDLATESADDNDLPVSVRVDLRTLSLFLGADQIGPKRVLANLVRNKLLQLFLIHDAVFMQFYLPSILE